MVNEKFRWRVSVFALALLTASGCKQSWVDPVPRSEAAALPASAQTPTANFADSIPRIALAEIRLGVEPGTTIGAQYDAFGGRVGEVFSAPDSLSPEQQKRFRDELIRALGEHGFSLEPRSEAIGLDASTQAPRTVHAIVSELFTEIRRNASRDETTARLRIVWEIVDRESAETVFRGTTPGQSIGASSPADAQAQAFREAAAAFAATPAAAAALRERSFRSALPPGFRPGETIELPASKETAPRASAEAMLQAAAPAVFSIRNPAGHGSGFFVREDGLALTSRHVIEGRKYWDAFLSDGRTIRMQVLREDAVCDTALLKACVEEKFPVLPLGDSGALQLGQEIWAMGTPVSLSLSQSVSRGIVSAMRSEAMRTLIQTDAAINPGSSGGPVLNRAGEVIGIANLKYRAAAVEGIGFCTSINDARAGLLLVVR